MKVIQLMTYPVKKIEEYIEAGGEFHGHNFFGYNSLQERGVSVHWIHPNRDNKIFQFLSKISGLKNEFFRLIVQFQCLSFKRKYDLIYVPNDMHIIILAILRWLRICRTPILMLCHFSYNVSYVPNPWIRIFKKIERYLVYKGVDKIIFANDSLLDIAMQDFNIPIRHRNSANWGANLAFFDSYKSRIGNPPSFEYFAAIGSANRDYEVLIEAFNYIDFDVKIFGKMGEASRMSDKNRANVQFYDLSKEGYRGMALLREYYYNCVAVLLPIKKVNDVPNGATVLIEALAMGKPIIITDLETNYIDVETEQVGLKVKLGDVKGWVNAINYLLENPDKAELMGKHAYDLAREVYNYEFFTDKILCEMNDLHQRKKN